MGYGLIVILFCACGWMLSMIVFGRRRDRGVAEFHIRDTTLESLIKPDLHQLCVQPRSGGERWPQSAVNYG
jgi:hypothetical protein